VAGLITAEQVAAIEAHERAAGGEPDGRPGPPATRRGSVAEAIGYVGAALVLGAIGLLLDELWAQLTAVGHLVLALAITGVLAGAALALRPTRTPAMQRLVSVLSAAVVAGVAWSATIVADDLLGLGVEDTALLAALAALLVATAIHLDRSRGLSHLVLFVTLLAATAALVMRPTLALDPLWTALVFAAVGGAWALLGAGGWIRPAPVATALGALVTLLSLQIGAVGDHRVLALLLLLVVAVGLVTIAVVTDDVVHLALGAVGLFLGVPQLVFELFGDAIGAPATLLLVGVLLVLLAVGLGRARREVLPPGGVS
jgi:hypothetical protein